MDEIEEKFDEELEEEEERILEGFCDECGDYCYSLTKCPEHWIPLGIVIEKLPEISCTLTLGMKTP